MARYGFRSCILAASVAASCAPPVRAADDETARDLSAIKGVAREGGGNDDAAPAWKRLVARGDSALLPTLEAMRGAGPLAANWLRSAVDAISEAERKAGRKLPEVALATFAADRTQDPDARRIGYELLSAERPVAARELLANFLDDPNLELRRDAIESARERVESAEPAARPDGYRKLLTFARDKDQVETLAAALVALGERVSLPEHFGYVTQWRLIGPFDGAGGTGYGIPYPPESGAVPEAKLKGKGGAELQWAPYVAVGKAATVDFNKGLGKHMDAVAYASAVIVSDAERPVEVRIGSQNALRIFLNGERIFEREEYHHGTRMDQHVGKGTLRAGKNVLLVKVCQNDQTQDWAQAWAIQCRLCDATGGALPATQVAVGDGTPKGVKLGFTPDTAESKGEKR